MAMYFYATKISAIVCATRCKRTVLQQSRGQRDRDKHKCRHGKRNRRRSRCTQGNSDSDDDDCCCCGRDDETSHQPDVGIFMLNTSSNTNAEVAIPTEFQLGNEEMLIQRRHSTEQLSALGLELGFQNLNLGPVDEAVQYDVPKNSHKLSQSVTEFKNSVLGSGGILYTNGRIISGPLESLLEVLNPKHISDLDKEFLFSFLLSSRLFMRPHELLGKLLDSVSDESSLEVFVALLSEWTQKFPYDYRDERMMNHVKHIVARCSDSHLEVIVSEVLSALLKRLTDLERHEADLRACQTNTDKFVAPLDCPTATQYAQILCRLEKKLAKHIGPEEFLQCSSMILLDKQKKWDQAVAPSSGPLGVQDPKKTCNLETYLDWSARLRLFVCNEILQCSGIEERSRIVELWSGVAQYCLLVGNYNSATAILESLESPAIARLKVTWSKLQVTCQQLDCMQRHAEGHGHLWQKQAIVLNEQQSRRIDKQPPAAVEAAATLIAEASSSTSSAATAIATTAIATTPATPSDHKALDEKPLASAVGQPVGITVTSGLPASPTTAEQAAQVLPATATGNANVQTVEVATATTTTSSICGKPNDWVVIPVFADIVKLALAERECCMQRLPNGHINVIAFDRMAAIVGAFTRHMHGMKATWSPSSGEYEHFCAHMQRTTKLGDADLMMASFACEEPNQAEKLMYDLN